jgi:hypothetical protein
MATGKSNVKDAALTAFMEKSELTLRDVRLIVIAWNCLTEKKVSQEFYSRHIHRSYDLDHQVA